MTDWTPRQHFGPRPIQDRPGVAEVARQTYDTSGPIELMITLPEATSGQVLDADNGFGHGYNVSFAVNKTLKNNQKHIELEVAVFVPATERGQGQPVLVEFVPEGAVEDADSKDRRTNQWIKGKTRLKKPGVQGKGKG